MAAQPKRKPKSKQTTTKPKNKGGRPRLLPNEKDIADILGQVESLAQLGATQDDMSLHLRISVDTLSRTPGFADAFKRGGATLRLSLRRAMVKAAINDGNVIQQIFLSKNLLGMRNTPIEPIALIDKPDTLVVQWKHKPKVEPSQSTSTTTQDQANSVSTNPLPSTKDLSVQ